MPYKLLFYFLVLVTPLQTLGQAITQSIRGTVVSEAGSPIPGVSITFVSDEAPQGGTTDDEGKFRINGVPVGRYTLALHAVGYNEMLIPGLLVDAGKETVLEIRLEKRIHDLQEVEVTASRSAGHQPNARTFTVEETKRFAATFYDPARLATSFPGVVGDNDQANNIVIRGNSPNGMLWRVEGLDMVNPNHLDNAGTFSDRAAMNGGGVNILSAQLLHNSQLLTGAFAPEYGNALSGVFNIFLRKGNNENKEFTGQISLLGIDIAAEGPFTKNKRSSYLVNYRYSTIGLLSAMGLDFGNEITNFQDLSFNLSFPTAKAGSFTLFGLGGLSSTLFNAQMDSAVWEYSRDRYDVDFYSKMAAAGLTHSIPFSSKISLRTSIGLSSKLVERTGRFIDDDYSLHTFQQDDNSLTKISAHTKLSYRLNTRHLITTGINSNELFFDVRALDGSETRPARTSFYGNGSYLLLQPYINWRAGLADRMIVNAGLHYMYLSLNGSQSIEPRFSALYDLGNDRSIALAYGLHSQVQQPGVYSTYVLLPDDRIAYPNKDLGFTKAHHSSASYSCSLVKNIKLKAEAYYQYLFDVPVSANTQSAFSLLNTLEAFAPDSLVNKGTGENYGIELSLEKILSNRYYFLLSSTVYESTYTVADGIKRNTRYNGKYAFSFSGGKEIHRSRNRVLGINIRAIYRGGYRETPIDKELSALALETVYMNDQPFAGQLDDYFRIDLRISSKKQKKGYTRTFALDIQNAANTKNIAYHYYDPLRNDIVAKYQLGIIPVISYRVEFGTRKN
jgi:hypothetical protein